MVGKSDLFSSLFYIWIQNFYLENRKLYYNNNPHVITSVTLIIFHDLESSFTSIYIYFWFFKHVNWIGKLNPSFVLFSFLPLFRIKTFLSWNIKRKLVIYSQKNSERKKNQQKKKKFIARIYYHYVVSYLSFFVDKLFTLWFWELKIQVFIGSVFIWQLFSLFSDQHI